MSIPQHKRQRRPAHDATNPPPWSACLAPATRAMMERAGYTGKNAIGLLARDSGVDRSQIWRLVTGELFWPDVYTLRKLADALHCSIDDLVGRRWPPSPSHDTPAVHDGHDAKGHRRPKRGG